MVDERGRVLFVNQQMRRADGAQCPPNGVPLE
jgi:hypothetical protein